jgi:hypothetical protein
MCRKYHDEHISKQCNLDRMGSGEHEEKESPRCRVPIVVSPPRAHDRGGESPPNGRGLGQRTQGVLLRR